VKPPAPAGKLAWVALYTHTGGMYKFLGEPVPIRNLRLTLGTRAPFKSARLLRSGQTLPLTPNPGGTISRIVAELGAYDVVFFQ